MISNPFNKPLVIPTPIKVGVKAEDSQINEVKTVKEEFNNEIKIESPKARVLRQYGGIESNIPVNHGYWRMP